MSNSFITYSGVFSFNRYIILLHAALQITILSSAGQKCSRPDKAEVTPSTKRFRSDNTPEDLNQQLYDAAIEGNHEKIPVLLQAG